MTRVVAAAESPTALFAPAHVRACAAVPDNIIKRDVLLSLYVYIYVCIYLNHMQLSRKHLLLSAVSIGRCTHLLHHTLAHALVAARACLSTHSRGCAAAVKRGSPAAEGGARPVHCSTIAAAVQAVHRRPVAAGQRRQDAQLQLAWPENAQKQGSNKQKQRNDWRAIGMSSGGKNARAKIFDDSLLLMLPALY